MEKFALAERLSERVSGTGEWKTFPFLSGTPKLKTF